MLPRRDTVLSTLLSNFAVAQAVLENRRTARMSEIHSALRTSTGRGEECRSSAAAPWSRWDVKTATASRASEIPPAASENVLTPPRSLSSALWRSSPRRFSSEVDAPVLLSRSAHIDWTSAVQRFRIPTGSARGVWDRGARQLPGAELQPGLALVRLRKGVPRRPPRAPRGAALREALGVRAGAPELLPAPLARHGCA